MGGVLRLCSGSNENNPRSSQDPSEPWVVLVKIQHSTLHRLGLVLSVSLLYCPLLDIANILHNTVER